MLISIPSGTFHKQPLDVASICRSCCACCLLQLIHDLKLKADRVYRKGVLARKVLHSACEKGLWEEEATDPVDRGGAVLSPCLYKLHSLL